MHFQGEMVHFFLKNEVLKKESVKTNRNEIFLLLAAINIAKYDNNNSSKFSQSNEREFYL